MVKPSYKLATDRIPELIKNGRFHGAKLLYLKTTTRGTGVVWQVIVPKKISKKAVTRNQLKRRLKEIVSHYFQTKSPRNRELLFIAKPGAQTATMQELQAQTHELLSNL